MWQPPLFQLVVDKTGAIVRFHPGLEVRAASYVIPFRVPWPIPKDLRQHNGGRAEFHPDRDLVYWRESSRKYETWYHNPWTGESWGREAAPISPDWNEASLVPEY